MLPNVGEDTERLPLLYTAGENVKWNHLGTVWQFLKKLNIYLPCGPIFPLLSNICAKTGI